MPALDVAGLKAAEAAAAVARQTTAAASGPSSVAASAATPAAPASPPSTSPPAMAAASAPAASTNDRQGATKTIFGVPAPRMPERSAEKAAERLAEDTGRGGRPAAASEQAAQRAERKTGARKTVVPAPAIIPPAAGTEPAPLATAASADASRSTHQGYGGPSGSTEVVPVKAPVMEDRTAPVRAASAKKSRGIPVWTYVGVGFLFGLALLGIYQLVGVLAH
jgi:hypothetical protein